MTNILCSDPRHSTRTAEVDYSAILGTTDKSTSPTGMICAACSRLRRTESTFSDGHNENSVELRFDGRVVVTIHRTYPGSDEILASKIIVLNVSDLTATERTQFRAIRDKLRDLCKAA